MMPHRTTSFKSAHKSANAFEFNAKAKSVAPLAVDQDGLDLMQNADKMSLAYAMMINNMNQLAENKPGRYTLMSNNFTEAADSLKGLKKYDVVRQRFEALNQVAKGIAFLEEGNAIEARPNIQAGLTALESAKQATMTNMDFGSTYLAVDQEVSVTKIIMDITETVIQDPSINALQILDILKRVMDVAAIVYNSNSPDAGMFKNVLRYNEIFANITKLFASKAGRGGVPITSGAGSVLVPFWSVELRYSFTTGTFLNKKSVEVNEPLLLSAMFATDAAALGNPRQVVTDIFASRPGGFFDSLKGSETSMSESGGIKTMVQSVAENSVGTRKVVVPVSTKNEAESFVLRYLKQCTSDDSKLKLIKPTVDKLIYVPCEITDSGVSLPSLGKVSPKSVGRMDQIKNLLI
jgi:hypothetical protein